MKNRSIFILLILLILSGCRKDFNDVKTTEVIQNPTIKEYTPTIESITADVTGIIIDENKNPISDALVKLNNLTVTTNNYGIFIIKNQSMNALGTLVQVEKEGYFPGSRRFFPKDGEMSRIQIELLAKTFSNSFIASEGGLIDIGNGASVEFSPNSIKDNLGGNYLGNVHIAAKWLDPSSLTAMDQMPGNLQGLNESVELVTLGTYGMIAVELEGDSGESLNIADGETAKISMPIPPSMLANAPATIPLWSYNEEHGLWVEESTATLQNGKYEGEVTHFSFWNCDIPFDAVTLDFRLVDDNANPLANYNVLLTIEEGNNNISTSGGGITDGNGNISGFVPANEILTLTVFDVCSQILFTQEIGPFANDTSLGDIIIPTSTVNATTISGILMDCDGNPLDSGLIVASFQGINIYHNITSPNFSFSFSTCSAIGDIEVIGLNPNTWEQSVVHLAQPEITNDLGNIEACNLPAENFMTITFDGTTFHYINAAVISSPDMTCFGVSGIDFEITFCFNGDTIGDYSTDHHIDRFDDFSNNLLFNTGVVPEFFTTFNVTQYDTKVVGNFSGDLINGLTGDTQNVTGTFNINL